MCEPVSIAIAAAALSAAATVTSGVAKFQQSRAQAKLYEHNAELARQQGLDDELAFREQAKRQISGQVAKLAKAGVRVDEGTSLTILRESVSNAEIDALAIRERAALQSWNLETQAGMARSAGTAALVGSVIGAGAKALGAASNISQIGGGGGAGGGAAAPARSPSPSFY